MIGVTGMFDGDTVYDGVNRRARVERDDLSAVYDNPLEYIDAAEHVTVRAVRLPGRMLRDWHETGYDELSDLWEEIEYRLHHCGFGFETLTVEQRAWEPSNAVTGGLIQTRDDAVEVFTRMARLRGVDVVFRELHGSVQGEWADVIAWSALDPASVEVALDTLEEVMRGGVYAVVVEESEVWTNTKGQMRTEWAEVDRCGGIIGDPESVCLDMLGEWAA